MNIKFLALGLIFMFFSFCATSSQDKTPKLGYMGYRELRIYENVTFERVWNGCKKALEDRGYNISIADKDDGHIRAGIRVRKSKLKEYEMVFSGYDDRYLTLSISETNGKVSV